MTAETRTCPSCNQPVEPGATLCAACGEALTGTNSWPTWHGQPPSAGITVTNQLVMADNGATEEFQKLVFDPALTNAPSTMSGSRVLVGLFGLLAVVWLVAEIMFARGNPAGYWTVIWYATGIGTIAVGVWLLWVTWRRWRARGWRTAWRRLLT